MNKLQAFLTELNKLSVNQGLKIKGFCVAARNLFLTNKKALNFAKYIYIVKND